MTKHLKNTLTDEMQMRGTLVAPRCLWITQLFKFLWNQTASLGAKEDGKEGKGKVAICQQTNAKF
jgi:hypothetical protein